MTSKQIWIALSATVLLIALYVIYRYINSPHRAIDRYQRLYDNPQLVPDEIDTTETLNRVARQIIPHISTSPPAMILARRLRDEHNVDLRENIPPNSDNYDTERAIDLIYAEQRAARDWRITPHIEPTRVPDIRIPKTPGARKLPVTEAKVAAEKQFFVRDSQSTHDNAVSVTFGHNVQNILNSIENTLSPRDTAVADLRNWTKANPRAAKTLERMISTNATVGIGDGAVSKMDEVGILRAIHARTNQPINADRRDDLIETLVSQLEYSNRPDRGGVVCPTGRTRNVVDALAQIDADPDLVKTQSTAQIKEMLMLRMENVMDQVEAAPPTDAPRILAEQQKKIKEEYHDYLGIISIEQFIDNGFAELRNLTAPDDDALG